MGAVLAVAFSVLVGVPCWLYLATAGGTVPVRRGPFGAVLGRVWRAARLVWWEVPLRVATGRYRCHPGCDPKRGGVPRPTAGIWMETESIGWGFRRRRQPPPFTGAREAPRTRREVVPPSTAAQDPPPPPF